MFAKSLMLVGTAVLLLATTPGCGSKQTAAPLPGGGHRSGSSLDGMPLAQAQKLLADPSTPPTMRVMLERRVHGSAQ